MKKKYLLSFVSFWMIFLSACTLPLSTAVTPDATFPAAMTTPTVIIISPTVIPTSTNIMITPTAVQSSDDTQTPVSDVSRRYAVILVENDDVLNIRSAAGAGNKITGSFASDAADVFSTGQTVRIGGETWLEVENPSGGSGWVNAWYLTEYAASQEFCAGSRVNTLIDDFKLAVNNEDGDLLKSLVSPVHGLKLTYWHNNTTADYTPDEASWVFDSTYKVNWGSGPSGLDDVGTFREFPLPALQEVLNDEDIEFQCNDLSSANMYLEPWPGIYSNVNFYALYKPGTPDVDLDWATWLAGVEYVEGKPYLFALIRFVWEP